VNPPSICSRRVAVAHSKSMLHVRLAILARFGERFGSNGFPVECECAAILEDVMQAVPEASKTPRHMKKLAWSVAKASEAFVGRAISYSPPREAKAAVHKFLQLAVNLAIVSESADALETIASGVCKQGATTLSLVDGLFEAIGNACNRWKSRVVSAGPVFSAEQEASWRARAHSLLRGLLLALLGAARELRQEHDAVVTRLFCEPIRGDSGLRLADAVNAVVCTRPPREGGAWTLSRVLAESAQTAPGKPDLECLGWKVLSCVGNQATLEVSTRALAVMLRNANPFAGPTTIVAMSVYTWRCILTLVWRAHAAGARSVVCSEQLAPLAHVHLAQLERSLHIAVKHPGSPESKPTIALHAAAVCCVVAKVVMLLRCSFAQKEDAIALRSVLHRWRDTECAEVDWSTKLIKSCVCSVLRLGDFV
jgi:hypothetical protein